jgi:hypothetical protein
MEQTLSTYFLGDIFCRYDFENNSVVLQLPRFRNGFNPSSRLQAPAVSIVLGNYMLYLLSVLRP